MHFFTLKACSISELYGHFDVNTGDWIDGLISNIYRDFNKPLDGQVSVYMYTFMLSWVFEFT